MRICETAACTGCGSCVSICPKDCIFLKYNADGFIVPIIDEIKCIECKKCVAHCPQNNSINLSRKREPDVYAAYAKDMSLLKKSASGGMFAVLAESILENGGVVYGAQMNDDFKTVFTRIETKEELSKLQGSKYVQSYTGSIYRKVSKDLTEGKKVLFSGLPCQIGGVYSFLGKDYPNLYTIDLICYGTCSQKVLESYLACREKREGSSITNLIFRHKVSKWKPMNYGTKIHMDFENGNFYERSLRWDSFGNIMMSGIGFNECCYSCAFNGFPRVADITIGDFLGLGVVEKTDFYCEYGISAVLLNSIKGCELYKCCKEKYYDEKRTLNEICYINKTLWSSVARNTNRDDFYRELEKDGMEAVLKKYIHNPVNCIKLAIKRGIIFFFGEKRTLWLMWKKALLDKTYPPSWPENKYINGSLKDK